jgi:hypothetical protein
MGDGPAVPRSERICCGTDGSNPAPSSGESGENAGLTRDRPRTGQRAITGGAGVAQIFITGSSDGLGLTAARLLIEQGHEVPCENVISSPSVLRISGRGA